MDWLRGEENIVKLRGERGDGGERRDGKRRGEGGMMERTRPYGEFRAIQYRNLQLLYIYSTTHIYISYIQYFTAQYAAK
jgi:hypothetical protein